MSLMQHLIIRLPFSNTDKSTVYYWLQNRRRTPLIKEFIKNAAEYLRTNKQTDLKILSTQPQYEKHIIGKYTYGVKSPLVLTDNNGGKNGTLKIGKYCSISSGVTIMLSGEHRPDWVTTYPFSAIFQNFRDYSEGVSATKGDVEIGNDVWIGMNVLILSGVKIGDGAVIGAGCVVAKDVEPYAIVAGNPARLIRKRFPQDVIDKLLELKWWNWDRAKISENMPYLMSNRIEEFVKRNSPNLLA